MQDAEPTRLPGNPLPEEDAMPAASGSRVTGAQPVSRAGRIALVAALCVLVLATFVSAMQAGFVNWDDARMLVYNERYRGLSVDHLFWMFSTSFAGHYQPLTWLTYAGDYLLWGLDPFGYHTTSVLLHLLTTVVFYLVTRRLLMLGSGYNNGDALRSVPVSAGAALAAVLFAIHPLRAESVTWISERRDVLSGFFYLLGLACYLRYASRQTVNGNDPSSPSTADTGGTGGLLMTQRTDWRWYVFAVLCCVFSLLAKATAMTMWAVLLILDVYPLRRLGHGRGASRRFALLEKVPFVVLGIVAGVRALAAQEAGGALYPLQTHDWLSRIAQACYGLTFYLYKTLWPVNLGPLYEIPPREVLLGSMFWISLIVLVVVVASAILLRRRCPGWPAALAIYAVTLAPMLGFAQSGPQLVADRYSYLSCMGFAVLGGGGLYYALRRWALLRRDNRLLLGLSVTVLVFLLHRATVMQNDIWRHPLTLWSWGVTVSPHSSIANVNYADALYRAQQFSDARYYYKKGLSIDPDDAVAHHHLGELYRDLGNTDQARHHLLRSLALDPSRTRACLTLAGLFNDEGRPDLAVKILRDGATRRPDDTNLVDFLSRMLASHPDPSVRDGSEALAWAEQVLAARGAYSVPALRTLAIAQAEVGNFDEAVETVQRALSLARAHEDERFMRGLNLLLKLFRNEQPYRMPT